MALNKIETGQAGEKLAQKFFLDKGYKILEKNFRCKFGEIDFIASSRNEELVFVEVRTKTNTFWGEPFETVNIKKQRKLYRLAEYYLKLRELEDRDCRFDVVSVVIDITGRLKKFDHIENAFGI